MCSHRIGLNSFFKFLSELVAPEKYMKIHRGEDFLFSDSLENDYDRILVFPLVYVLTTRNINELVEGGMVSLSKW